MKKTSANRQKSVRVTLRHVAEEAGVSVATVSDIVNRGRSESYTAQMQQRVHAAIRQLGYRPTLAARTLRRGRSDTVGVILTRNFDNPYYARLFNEIKTALEPNQLSVELMLLDASRPGMARRCSDRMFSQGVDAIIIGPLYYWDQILVKELGDLKNFNTPVITFGAVQESAFAHNVSFHDDGGGEIAAGHLVDAGHRRIAFLGAYDPEDAHLGRGSIQEGFVRGLTQRQLRLNKEWFFPSPDDGKFQSGFDHALGFARRWLATSAADRPTALMCKNDQLAIAALAALHRSGVRVPDDLSVMGYDNVPESGYTIPALSTVDSGVATRVHEIALRLFNLIGPGNEPLRQPPPHTPQLVARDSVRPPK